MRKINLNLSVVIFSFIALAISGQSCFQKKPDALTRDAIDESALPDSMLRDRHTAENSLDFEGKYTGILPCTDCEGIRTEIILNDNKTYHKSEVYLGKSDTLTSEEGKWVIHGSIVRLRNQLNATQLYFAGENYIQQLDSTGKKITGEMAEHYILQKATGL